MKAQHFYTITAIFFLTFGIKSATEAQTEALVISSTTLDQKAKATTSKMYLKDDKLVTESGEGKNKSVMMFDTGKETLFIIDHKKKEYTEMTREDMEALNAMLQEQMAAMEQQFAMLPEKQREMIREKMGASLGMGQKPAEYSLAESGVAVKEWESDKYIGEADGKTQSEIYIASYEEVGQDAADFATLEKFFDLMKDYMQGMSKSLSGAGMGYFSESMPGYKEGIPVKTVFYNKKDEVISTTTLESVSEETVENSIFEIPENYKKQKMDKMAQN